MKRSILILTCILCTALLISACAAPPVSAGTQPVSASTPVPEAEPETPVQPDTPVDATLAPDGELVQTVVWPDPGIEGNLPEHPSPKDDLAAYLNYDWYKDVEIPEGYSAWSSFSQLGEDVRTQMLETLKAPDDSPDQQKAAALFAAVMDAKTRDAAGIGSIGKTLEAILQAQSLEELNKVFESDANLFYFTPLVVTNVAADAKNSDINVASVYAPYLSLQDSAEYAALTEQGARMKAANETFYKALLTHNGVDAAEADRLIADAFAWETQLAKGVYPVETSYREDYYTLTYNEYTPEALVELAPDVPLMTVFAKVGLEKASRFIVSEPEALKTLNSIYTEENLPGIKGYLATNLLSMTASYCDSFSDDASIAFSNAIYGSTGRKPDDVRAFSLCDSLFGELLGRVYAAKYSDKAAKEDVTAMVQEIFSVYKARLSAADWLSEDTQETAVEKLDNMMLRIGYPEVFRYDWDKINIDGKKPLIENAIAIVAEQTRQLYALVDQPVNKEVWSMSAHTVNAYYEPSDNSINFPAAILHPPFYDPSGSRSKNLGGIGNVIAHEITHAFDTTGSQFDKNGNMENWWTDEDRAAFKARTDKVAARYASIEVLDGEHVRGDLTIGETVADLGAVACTLDIVKTLENPDYKSYFGAWVGVWAQRITPETRDYYLKYDPHAPSYLRANVTLQQFDELYQTYDIQPGDFMYTALEDRLKVW